MYFEADNTYKQFNQTLIQSTWPMVGVRVPVIRQLAKEAISDGRWQEILAQPPTTYEEVQLHSFLIAQAPWTPQQRMARIEQFFPLMDNWAVVDGLCSSLKETKKYEQLYWQWLQQFTASDAPYVTRFVFVMYLNYFVKPPYLEEVLAQLEANEDEHYYIHMAVAWALSMAYIKNPERVMSFLTTTTMPTKNYNKALQKIRESKRVSVEQKAIFKQMKRN